MISVSFSSVTAYFSTGTPITADAAILVLQDGVTGESGDGNYEVTFPSNEVAVYNVGTNGPALHVVKGTQPYDTRVHRLWQFTVIGGKIAGQRDLRIVGGVSSSNIADNIMLLSADADVYINAPTEGQLLTYNASSKQWNNADLNSTDTGNFVDLRTAQNIEGIKTFLASIEAYANVDVHNAQVNIANDATTYQLALTDVAGSLPNKFIRALGNGQFEILSSDATRVIFTLDDSGNLNVTGGIVGGIGLKVPNGDLEFNAGFVTLNGTKLALVPNKASNGGYIANEANTIPLINWDDSGNVYIAGNVYAANLSGTNNQLISSFEYEQPIASTSWDIKHNLNRYCSVTAIDSANTPIIGDVTYISVNELTITFSAATGGSAYLV